mmetsp:Transcript_137288/g.238760  ORF Transcript_137288/g.238760 Transcript_137288/m.238760 type:complete len:229 (-) Transcript_137288:2000-2686(-)
MTGVMQWMISWCQPLERPAVLYVKCRPQAECHLVLMGARSISSPVTPSPCSHFGPSGQEQHPTPESGGMPYGRPRGPAFVRPMGLSCGTMKQLCRPAGARATSHPGHLGRPKRVWGVQTPSHREDTGAESTSSLGGPCRRVHRNHWAEPLEAQWDSDRNPAGKVSRPLNLTPTPTLTLTKCVGFQRTPWDVRRWPTRGARSAIPDPWAGTLGSKKQGGQTVRGWGHCE